MDRSTLGQIKTFYGVMNGDIDLKKNFKCYLDAPIISIKGCICLSIHQSIRPSVHSSFAQTALPYSLHIFQKSILNALSILSKNILNSSFIVKMKPKTPVSDYTLHHQQFMLPLSDKEGYMGYPCRKIEVCRPTIY